MTEVNVRRYKTLLEEVADATLCLWPVEPAFQVK